MSKIKKVWVIAEKESALAQLCAGGRQLGEEVAAVVLGTKEETGKAITMGADTVYWLGEFKPENRMEDYVKTVLELLKQERPDLLMVQPTKRGKLIAGRLAASMGTSVLVDAAKIKIDEKVQVTHLVYGGAAFRTEQSLTETTIVTVGAGVYTALPEDTSRQGNVISVDYLEPSNKVKLLEKKTKPSATVNLGAAKRVVGVGRGIANQEDIKIAEELAEQIGAEVGCSRPIAEGVNWLPTERYIGVSGAILKPEVYLAVGISGQVQHLVGVNQAKVIIAVNKDKAAPIFKHADYGIVGDLYKVLPLLIEKFKANK
ncbi:electron transfer flavoprotein subunit alpha/FixB family protein [Desulfitobacterium sp.]|uniref:electron transfer flavoprotein subunit alpha/FixB family protein n=1 Tax=Desulfitobacterium sp. TaxID=49981 RepID=UPI002B626992|nr:FAD-binding protein [Desulfitobacterium sp.]HVJ48682.1 FAD-binding protein [Desulfitobacterium sp.]